MNHVPMTRTDAGELWDLLCKVDGPRDCPEIITEDKWRAGGVDAWWEMAKAFDWDRAEVFPAVETLARWKREQDWPWPGEVDEQGRPRSMPLLPVVINRLIRLRQWLKTGPTPEDTEPIGAEPWRSRHDPRSPR